MYISVDEVLSPNYHLSPDLAKLQILTSEQTLKTVSRRENVQRNDGEK